MRRSRPDTPSPPRSPSSRRSSPWSPPDGSRSPAPPRRKQQVNDMNMDWTPDGGTRLSDPLAAADEPLPGAPEPVTNRAARFLPSTRYRHPGDVIRLIGSGLALTAMLVALALAPGRLTGPGAAAVTWLGSDPAGRLLTGLAQVAFVVA